MRTLKNGLQVLATAAVFLLIPASAYSQATFGTITGIVRDCIHATDVIYGIAQGG